MAYGSVNVPGAMPHKQDALTGLPGQVVRFDGMGLPYAAEGWSGRNLLINWDFRNPVNRNGREEYTGSGSYCIDRYIIRNNVTVQVTDNGLVISRSDTVFAGISQPIKDGPKLLAGKTVTLSALIDELSCGSVEIFLGNSNAPHLAENSYGTVRTKAAGLISTTITLPDELPNDYLTAFLWIDSEANGGTVGSVKPAAWKLELGDHQTLARQNEDGEWELIDPPDYDLQYALCSLYSPSTGEWVGYQHINPDLLINSYWANKDAIINQRGQDEYTASGYAIDGWRKTTGNSSVLHVDDAGLIASGIRAMIRQMVDDKTIFEGKALTCSILLEDSGLKTISVSSFDVSKTFAYNSTSNNFALNNTNTSYPNEIVALEIPTSEHAIAAKLELGPVQTLAHQDADGNWVLNDPPPNKALELAKCQRRQFVLSKKHSVYEHVFFGTVNDSASRLLLEIPLPVPLRAKPTISLSDDIKMVIFTAEGYPTWTTSGSAVPTDTIVYYNDEFAPKLNVGFRFGDNKFDDNVTRAPVAALITSGRIIFDANL